MLDFLSRLYQQEQASINREKWVVFEDIARSSLLQGPQPGDLRAAFAPFLANDTMGKL